MTLRRELNSLSLDLPTCSMSIIIVSISKSLETIKQDSAYIIRKNKSDSVLDLSLFTLTFGFYCFCYKLITKGVLPISLNYT